MNKKSDAERAAMWLVERLRAVGHIAYLAGGCVRDRLLGLEPKDYDVATDALPDKVQAIFPGSQLVGAKFGVVVVKRFNRMTDVATFRSEGQYSDGRHPDAVVFGDEVRDAKRRDFTINGLFFDPATDRVIDYVGGQEDLKAGIVRTIGDPLLRFGEDHLRMLRGVRLSARMGFLLEPETAAAIRELRAKLISVSPERIWQELELMLRSGTRAQGWRLLTDLGLHEFLSPALGGDISNERIHARLAALERGELDAVTALAAILLDRSAHDLERIGRALRLSNGQIEDLRFLVTGAGAWEARGPDMELADLKELVAHRAWRFLLELLRAVEISDNSALARWELLRGRAESIAAHDIQPPPLLRGEDIMALGVPQGPKLGEIMRAIYRAQLNESIRSRDEAMELARQLFNTA